MSSLFPPLAVLEQGLERVRQSPRDAGTVGMIVCRPDVGERRELKTAELTPDAGLIGDNWLSRSRRPFRAPRTDRQLTLMNMRVIELIAGERDRWKLAGDQLYVDLDLSGGNLPPGTQLAVGTAVIEVSAEPHLGCRKFRDRYGRDAVKFVNSGTGRSMNLRGINAKVIAAGVVETGSPIRKVSR